MESRVIIFLVLSLVIIAAFPYFLTKMGIQTPDSITEQSGQQAAQSDASKQKKRNGVHPLADGSSQTPSTEDVGSSTPLVPQSDQVLPLETLKVIEGDLYRVVLSSYGGTIKEWQLKRYTAPDAEGVEQPIQLVPLVGAESPLAITLPEDPSFQNQSYAFDATTLQLNKNSPTGKVVMTAALPDGQSITKELVFHNDQYQADITIHADGFKNGYRLLMGSNFGITDWENTMGGKAGPISMIDGKVVSERPEQTTVTYETGATWFGLNDKYFMSVLIPHPDKIDSVVMTNGSGSPASGVPTAMAGVPVGVPTVSVQGVSEHEFSTSVRIPANQKKAAFTLYAGPKEYDRLVSYRQYLEEAIDFGWFIHGSWLPVRLVAKPLFYVLRFIYGLTQNYGFSIILLTILLKLLLHPITKKSLVSMKQMAALQPKVTQIRAKWADNKEKMNKELMNLYKDKGINPLGGCMPMLLQMPIFIALFNILYITIDLKNAPFIFWISDLSAQDPYYVLPIIMGATMIIQQMTQPSTMDPMQAKIMMFMPVVYTFFFLTFPSGLVLYWLVNNVLSIAQQYWINKQIPTAST
jgi:YidC/Oxa1 family membrane protein insertase